MIDLSTVGHNPCLEELTNLLCNKTQNTDKGFFRVEVAYFLCKIASCMRAYINTKDRGKVPINCYAIALANSGQGKGYSMNIMENEVISGFKKAFCEETFNYIAEKNLTARAIERANKAVIANQDIELDRLKAAYDRTGSYIFTFDSGTTPAIKQLRTKLLLAGIGAINLQIDEAGSNLLANTEILNTFLELYDQGLLKPKLIKNTSESIRDDDIDGKTPANLMLFGTPVKLFDGSTTEDAFYSFLETGYARRCLFGLGVDNKNKAYYSQTPAQIYQNLIKSQNQYVIDKWNTHFTSLAQPNLYNWEIKLEDDVAIKLLEYRIDCEKRADELNEYAEIQKAELSHRYFKALKLAGAFAYVDNATELKEDYLNQAIKLVEESGNHFTSILNREKSYMKLAKYLATVDDEVTHADLTEALPFYKQSSTQRNEMMSMAMAWGYKNKIIIKKTFADGIEFFKGEALKKTDLSKIIISYSNHYAYNYYNDYGPWDNMEVVFTAANTHWCNHHFNEGNRCTEKAMLPFNMVVVDVDSGISLSNAQELLHEYMYIMYTTKRSTDDNNRFRIIIPLEYVLELDNEDYKEFMNNVLKWLPFQSDEAANQIAKKWEAYDKATVVKNDGKLLDPFPFIPKTSRNEQYLKNYQKIESMDNLTRWFASKMQIGDRNNQMLKYALCLKDSGLPYEEVESRVLAFNKQLKNPLTENEIRNSILVTTAKAYV